jgi:phospholipid-translocating ATPase
VQITLLTVYNRFIETHSKTITNGIAMFLSVGGWFLWNIILSSLYDPENKIYYVRDTFLRGFGASLSWWLCLILILLAVIVFEMTVQSLLAAYLTTDENVFQALEKDPGVKRRFEEAASGELQAGWDRKTNKEREEEERVKQVVDTIKQMEEERREGEIKDLLRNRVKAVGGDESPERAGMGAETNHGDVNRILSRGYGEVRVH